MGINEEEAWLHHTVKDFEYVVTSGKYGVLFFDLLGDDAKQVLRNMFTAEDNNLKVVPYEEDFALERV
jgi:hypothetical protein